MAIPNTRKNLCFIGAFFLCAAAFVLCIKQVDSADANWDDYFAAVRHRMDIYIQFATEHGVYEDVDLPWPQFGQQIANQVHADFVQFIQTDGHINEQEAVPLQPINMDPFSDHAHKVMYCSLAVQTYEKNFPKSRIGCGRFSARFKSWTQQTREISAMATLQDEMVVELNSKFVPEESKLQQMITMCNGNIGDQIVVASMNQALDKIHGALVVAVEGILEVIQAEMTRYSVLKVMKTDDFLNRIYVELATSAGKHLIETPIGEQDLSLYCALFRPIDIIWFRFTANSLCSDYQATNTIEWRTQSNQIVTFEFSEQEPSVLADVKIT